MESSKTNLFSKGGGEALTDLLGGHVEIVMTMTSIAPVLPHAKAGKLRVVTTTGRQRIPSLPQVQTIAEAGLPEAEIVIWWGIVAPAATPRPIIDRLNREVVRAVALPQVRDQYLQQAVYPETSTPEKFAQLIREEHARWTKVIRTAGIKLE